jgi:hypothetical protein
LVRNAINRANCECREHTGYLILAWCHAIGMKPRNGIVRVITVQDALTVSCGNSRHEAQ